MPVPTPVSRTAAALALLAAALAFMALSAWSYAPVWERAFRSDASPVSWLSSALLLTLAAMALRLMTDGGLPRMLGGWMAAAMFVLALDEQFMFHELWKYRCEEWLALCRFEAVHEAPMLGVAVVGTITIVALHRAMRSRLSRGLLWAGLAIGLWAITVDQVAIPWPIAELEEAFEVLAEALVLAAFVSLPPGRG
jgi:xanthine/uracil permease